MASSVDAADLQQLAFTVYDLIRDIRDPEKPESLEELEVVYEDGVAVEMLENDLPLIIIEFKPTVPHCSLATLIGLCMRVKLERNLPEKHKITSKLRIGKLRMISRFLQINKQINDKERISAAMENPNLRALVEQCIVERDM